MKKVLSLFLVSALGGLFTLTVYKVFLEKPEVVYKQQESSLENFSTTFNSTANLAAETTDFTTAAERTFNAVVHVKNKSIYTTPKPDGRKFFMGKSSTKKTGTNLEWGGGVIYFRKMGYIITNNPVNKKTPPKNWKSPFK